MDIILALIALGILVIVHETGHFIAARFCGVMVEVYSIGFGKPLIKMRRHGIEYRLSWLPLGGYVRMKGEAPDAEDSSAEDGFNQAKWWKKVIIGVAGPLANLVLALLIFILTFVIPGKVEDQNPVVGISTGNYSSYFQSGDSILAVNSQPVRGWYQFISMLVVQGPRQIKLKRQESVIDVKLPTINPQTLNDDLLPAVPAEIGDVSPGMPAWQAGLQSGDIITKIDSVQIGDWYQMRKLIADSKQNSVVLTVRRGSQTFHKQLLLQTNPLSDKQRMIGITQIMPVSYKQSYPAGEAIMNGVKSTFGFIALNYVGLYMIFSHPSTLKSSVGGPVMIYTLSSQSAHKGFTSWLLFVAAISLVLMIMNLLPIPVLDGGHIFFAIIQGILGKPLPAKVQLVLQNIGLVLLLSLMVFAFYNDFTKVWSRALSRVGTH